MFDDLIPTKKKDEKIKLIHRCSNCQAEWESINVDIFCLMCGSCRVSVTKVPI